jgi:flagellar protein FlaG
MGVDSISSVTMSPVARIEGHAAPKATATEEAVPLPKKPEPDRKARSDADTLSHLDAFVEAANGKLSRVNRRIDIYIVEDSHEVAARVVDTESNEVVKYIPSQELLALRSRIDKMVGFLFDKGA